MSRVNKGSGTTQSEKYLAKLAERTFLNLWSYPNVYVDKRQNGRGHGKELCDLLVVCGDHILIFSDKTIGWPTNPDPEVCWRRWFNRAVVHSVEQVRKAQRRITVMPDRIYLDPSCTQKLPIPLPPPDTRTVHGIVVARGAEDACRRYFGGGSGSMVVLPELRGDDHVRQNDLQPFAVGDVNPNGPFVHVFDETSLEVALRELDTVRDLADYLVKKEKLTRSGILIKADGEEDLVAYYMTHMEADQEHGFPRPDGSPWGTGERFALEPGTFRKMRTHPQYLRKRSAEEASYVWDRLIEAFTNNMLAGTTIVPGGGPFRIADHEVGVRHMALVPRYMRRLLGEAIIDGLQRGAKSDRFTRALLPGPSEKNRDTGFFIMTLAVPSLELPGGYERYREVRRDMLEVYALTHLRNAPYLKRIIGVGLEPPANTSSRSGASEDLVMAEVPEWTPELIRELENGQRAFDIANPSNVREFAVTGKEFPDAPNVQIEIEPRQTLNRRQRRAALARARRKPK